MQSVFNIASPTYKLYEGTGDDQKEVSIEEFDEET